MSVTVSAGIAESHVEEAALRADVYEQFVEAVT